MIGALVLFYSSEKSYAASVNENEESLERLFTTKKERNSLNKARLKYTPKTMDSASEDDDGNPIKVKKETKVVLNGFIKRSDGKSVVWINDSNTMGEELDKQGIKVNTKKMKKNLIQFSVPGRKVSMKPGQAVDIANGKVIEVYNLPKKEDNKSQVTSGLTRDSDARVRNE